MEFYILRNQIINTGPKYQLTSSPAGLIERSLNVPKAKIQASQNDDGTDNQKYAENLVSALIENLWIMKNENSSVDWNLEAAICLPEPSSNRAAVDKSSSLKFFVRSRVGFVDNFLEILHNTFNVRGGGGRNVTVNVVVEDFGSTKRSQDDTSTITLNAKGLKLEKIVNGSNNTVIACSCPLVTSGSPAETRMLVAWENVEEFSGVFTVSVVLNDSALCLLNSLSKVPKEGCERYKDMLEKEICTDLEIHAGLSPNHRAIKCHRAILAAGSTVFQRMFENGMKEARKNKIEILEMSETGVRALLAYLYHGEIKAAYECSEVALELLQAGEKYDIQELKDTVREFMMAKESAWFGVDVVLTLYVYARVLCSKQEVEIADEETQEDGGDIEMQSGEVEDEEMGAWKSLKLKCLRTLKWYFKNKPKTLLESAKYHEVLGGNLKLATEINYGIFRLD